MNNIEDFITTCESLMINEDDIVMENSTTIDTLKIVTGYKVELKNNHEALKIYKKRRDVNKYIQYIDERISILTRLNKEIGSVEESVFRNIAGSLFTLGIFLGIKIGTNIVIQKMKKSPDYTKKFGGNLTKALFYDQYLAEIEYWEFLKKHIDTEEWK